MRNVSTQSNTPAQGPHERRPLTPRGEAQRRALVDAAFSLIAEEGFEGLRTRDVAARAGVNIATLHYYFASKEDLIRSVVERVWHEFETFHAPSWSSTPPTPLEGIIREAVDLEYHLHYRPETFRVLFEIITRGLHDRAVHSVMSEHTRRWEGDLAGSWENVIETFLAQGVRQGDFRQDLDVHATAMDIVALLIGSLTLAMTAQVPFPTARVRGHIERLVLPDAAREPRR